MVINRCDPCCQIGGNLTSPVFYQNALQVLCAILAAGGGGTPGNRQIVQIAGACLVGSYTASADGTTTVLVSATAVAAGAAIGDIVSFTSGDNDNLQAVVVGVSGNNLTLSPALPNATANGDAFNLYSSNIITSDCDGNLNVNVASAGTTVITPGTVTAVGVGTPVEFLRTHDLDLSVQVAPDATNAATSWQIDLELSTSYPAVPNIWTPVMTFTDMSSTMLSLSGFVATAYRFRGVSFAGGAPVFNTNVSYFTL